ncbi:MAG TPA: glutathione S-transferase family protein [Caulobacteraceae bacterium]|nr:glutathione S-transferase family protein [Caulobacteraceae bacterium]
MFLVALQSQSYSRHKPWATKNKVAAMITIYGDRISGNCLKVKWTAERLAIPFTWIDVNVVNRETRTETFLAMNPAGQVPTIVLEDGRPLAQSNAIILHLAERSALIPADAYERAKMFEWLFWEQYSHEPTIAVVRFQVKYLGKPRSEVDPALAARAEAALVLMDRALSGQQFLVGAQLTLADIALVAYTRFAADGGFDLADYPAVDAWVRRVEHELPIRDPR